MRLFLALTLTTSMSAQAGTFNHQGHWDYLVVKDIPGEAEKLDLRESDPIPKAKNSEYQTDLKAIYGESCTKMVAPLTVEKKLLLNQVVLDATRSILTCREHYPELAPYLGQWAHTLRRHRIECSTKTSKEKKAAGWSNFEGKTTFPKDVIETITRTGQVMNVRGKAQIMTTYTYPIDTLIHECFHSTDANNLPAAQHNDTERIEPQTRKTKPSWLDPTLDCKNDVTNDRISAVESLCSGNPINSSKSGAKAVLYEKMLSCGIGWCERLFTRTAKDNAEDLTEYFTARGTPSHGLPKKEATSLCKSIYNDGYCLYDRNKNGFLIMRSNPGVQKARAKILKKVREFFPSWKNEIPGALIAAFPEIKARLDSFTSDRCFQAAFNSTPNGTLLLKEGINEPFDSDDLFFDNFEYDVADHLNNNILGKLDKRLESAKLCKNSAHKNEIWKVFQDFFQALKSFYNNTENRLKIKELFTFASGTYEKIELPENTSEAVPLNPKAVSNLFGKDIISLLDETLRKHHPKSYKYDCKANGLIFYGKKNPRKKNAQAHQATSAETHDPEKTSGHPSQ